MAASNVAVAGMEPVEPATITGPDGGLRCRWAASAKIRALRCAAGVSLLLRLDLVPLRFHLVRRETRVGGKDVRVSAHELRAHRVEGIRDVEAALIVADLRQEDALEDQVADLFER